MSVVVVVGLVVVIVDDDEVLVVVLGTSEPFWHAQNCRAAERRSSSLVKNWT